MADTRKLSFFKSISAVLHRTRMHFREINFDKTLTEDDKKKLKEFYLDNFVTPRARTVLRQFHPEDFEDPPHPDRH